MMRGRDCRGDWMRAIVIAACLACGATAAPAADSFPFKADEFHVAFNDYAKAEKTEREATRPGCKAGRPRVCRYNFTPALYATVTSDAPEAAAKEVVLVFARPKNNVKAEYLYSYKVYADLVAVLSKEAADDARGAAMKTLLGSIHTKVKEVAVVGDVHYTMDMKREGVRFVARPAALVAP
jgi:hypothetical protein